MTEKRPSQDRSQALPALLAAALAAVAIVVAVISLVSETPSLSLIAAAIATLLAMVVVWLNGNYVAQGQRLISAESELTRLQSTTIADSVAMRITGERPAGLDTIRTPGGDLTGLNLSDMSRACWASGTS
jgi:hypothetical protein